MELRTDAPLDTGAARVRATGAAAAVGGRVPADRGDVGARIEARSGTVSALSSSARARDQRHARCTTAGVLDPGELNVIRVILTLAALAGFAYVINLPWARRWQDRLGIAQLAVAGLPFVVLGVLARSVGVLDDALLAQLSPLIEIALAVVGVRIGLRVDVPHLIAAPRPVVILVAARVALGWLVMVGASLVVIRVMRGALDIAAIRDAIVLALAGSVTSAAAGRGLTGLLATEDAPLAERVIRIAELASVLGFLVLTVRVRSSRAAPTELPWELWLLIAVGLAAVLGLLVYAIVRDRAARGHGAAVLAIGTVATVAGVATYLGFSPLGIAVLVGATVGQLVGPGRETLEALFDSYQRSIYALLLFVLGVIAVPLTPLAIVLALAFVIARTGVHVGATRLGLVLAESRVDREALRRLGVSPMGATAIAIVISAQTVYPEADVAPAALAVICASVVAELLLRVPLREARRAPRPPRPWELAGDTGDQR